MALLTSVFVRVARQLREQGELGKLFIYSVLVLYGQSEGNGGDRHLYVL